MRIAVIGSGIAGNAAAWSLRTGSSHEVVLYEKSDRAGGHAATVDVDYDGRRLAVDTGFIVYNELNYPDLTALFAHLGVETKASDMGFSVSGGNGAQEWAGRGDGMLDGLFARRRNIVSLAHYRMIREMFRFNRQAMADWQAGRLRGQSIGAYLEAEGYSPRFRDAYLVPMGAAIWSMPPSRLVDFPAESFVAFFANHRLMHWDRPVWRTVEGGSREYVRKLTAPLGDALRLSTGVRSVVRTGNDVVVTDVHGHEDRFDHVVLAGHADQSLAIVADATARERAVLSAVAFRPNEVWLHRDPALMPKRRAAWTAWNVLASDDPEAELCLTYWMNALQGIDRDCPLFVTLNPPAPPRPELVFGRWTFEHPQFDAGALDAQARLGSIQGHDRLWFAGAWTGYGFHEDGLRSGLDVAQALGASVPWRPLAKLPAAAE